MYLCYCSEAKWLTKLCSEFVWKERKKKQNKTEFPSGWSYRSDKHTKFTSEEEVWYLPIFLSRFSKERKARKKKSDSFYFPTHTESATEKKNKTKTQPTTKQTINTVCLVFWKAGKNTHPFLQTVHLKRKKQNKTLFHFSYNYSKSHDFMLN